MGGRNKIAKPAMGKKRDKGGGSKNIGLYILGSWIHSNV